VNSDFKDLLALLNQFQARYLIIGGYAVMLYADPRYTKDLDIMVGVSEADLLAVRKALHEFGFPMSDEAADELLLPKRMISIGRAPSRIDLLNELEGVDFEAAYSRRNIVDFGGVSVPFISKEDLIANKLAVGRPQDIQDLKRLRGKTQ
jgi:predicted nucleotidyltransferase